MALTFVLDLVLGPPSFRGMTFVLKEVKTNLYPVQNPRPACYLLAAPIVTNKPMKTQDETSHETATGHVYMIAVSNCFVLIYWYEYGGRERSVSWIHYFPLKRAL